MVALLEFLNWSPWLSKPPRETKKICRFTPSVSRAAIMLATERIWLASRLLCDTPDELMKVVGGAGLIGNFSNTLPEPSFAGAPFTSRL